jgi:hypothetical protein
MWLRIRWDIRIEIMSVSMYSMPRTWVYLRPNGNQISYYRWKWIIEIFYINNFFANCPGYTSYSRIHTFTSNIIKKVNDCSVIFRLGVWILSGSGAAILQKIGNATLTPFTVNVDYAQCIIKSAGTVGAPNLTITQKSIFFSIVDAKTYWTMYVLVHCTYAIQYTDVTLRCTYIMAE